MNVITLILMLQIYKVNVVTVFNISIVYASFLRLLMHSALFLAGQGYSILSHFMY